MNKREITGSTSVEIESVYSICNIDFSREVVLDA
jgi:hypothetical protein